MAISNEYLRGLILEFLYTIYPDKVAEGSIKSAFYQYYRYVDIEKALAFLTDSAYIEKIEKRHPVYKKRKIVFYQIKVKGIALSEGNADDPCIVVVDHEEENGKKK